jgi:hypothetical protein
MPRDGSSRHNAGRSVSQVRSKRLVKRFFGPVHEVGPGAAVDMQVDVTRDNETVVVNSFDAMIRATYNYISRSDIDDAAMAHEQRPVRKYPVG